MKEAIVEVVKKHYLESGDFNGIVLYDLIKRIGTSREELIPVLKDLINEDKINIIQGKDEVNPHIIRIGFPKKATQKKNLSDIDPLHTCVYPHAKYLQESLDRKSYQDRPYELELALGNPQLSFRHYDLSVLESYRNDPRYYYETDDVNGSIYLSTEFYESNQVDEKDKILLSSFGFSYNSEYNRAVTVFLRYLADLTPEHQQIWLHKELKGNYKVHPDYYRNNVIGDWGEKVSIFIAFCTELYIINRMAEAMERPKLMQKDFGEYAEENRPKKFGFLIRPTLKEYNDFVHLLDKLLSENINKKFFQKDISDEIEQVRKDQKIIIQPKGTIQMLDEWARKRFRTNDWKPWEECVSTLKKIRMERQKPAHSIEEDTFDQKYFQKQRELMIDAYSAIRIIRLLLENDRKVRNAKIEIPSWLQKGGIWTF